MSTTEVVTPELEEDPLPREPSDFEYAGLMDGDMRFLSCTRCGALVTADAANITRHNEMHREKQQQVFVQNIIPPRDDSMTGPDIAKLLREVVKTRMRDQGITQLSLSKEAGVSQKHLSQMLTGGAVGSLKLWDNIVKALDCAWKVSLVPADD